MAPSARPSRVKVREHRERLRKQGPRGQTASRRHRAGRQPRCDSLDATASVTACASTTEETEAPLLRLSVEPTERDGLRVACRLAMEKITTVPRTKVGAHVARLDDEDILRPNQAALVFIGLAVSPRTRHEA